ncbi:MAG TPA: hypothetical protein VIZ67_03240 [Acidimicrobiales bacterium]
MRGTASVVIAVLVGAAVGCTADDDTAADTGETAESAAPVTATLQRSTLFETHRSLRLTVTNDASQDLVIEAVQLSSPLFEPVALQTRDVPVAASDRVAIPLPFGTAQCDDVTDEPPELIARLAGEEVRVALEERPSGLLSTLHDLECAATEVLASVDLRLGDTWKRTEARTIEGEIELDQRSSGVTAMLDEVRGNVIFSVSTAGAGGAPVEVADDEPSAAGRIAITAARCDPHALIEYKRTFIFSAYVEVDGGERTRVDITAEGGARRALEELLRSCIG